MGAVEVVAKPAFNKAEMQWLMRLRETRMHSAGPPWFTLVFPGSASSIKEIVDHIGATCAVTSRIRFCLRSAMIVPDFNMSWFHVFLVPDKGFGAIIRLHDRLHVGPLASCLRPETPYIPHLTVASVRELDLARRTKASLNSQDLAISGRIDEIEVNERQADGSRCVARVGLGKSRLFH
jgi:2'-5' RNA ligase